MKTIALGIIAIALSACIQYRDDSAFSRADIEAMNARAQCKMMARTSVQISRCETR